MGKVLCNQIRAESVSHAFRTLQPSLQTEARVSFSRMSIGISLGFPHEDELVRLGDLSQSKISHFSRELYHSESEQAGNVPD